VLRFLGSLIGPLYNLRVVQYVTWVIGAAIAGVVAAT
jgi:hypothetical protein